MATLKFTLKILNWSKILTQVCWLKNGDIYTRIHVRKCQSNWFQNDLIKAAAIIQIKEVNYSSRSSFLYNSHHRALGRQRTTYHNISALLNTKVNFQSCARQQSSSQGSSFTDVCPIHNAEKTQRLRRAYILTVTKSTWNKFGYKGLNVYALPTDGDYYWERICQHVLAT